MSTDDGWLPGPVPTMAPAQRIGDAERDRAVAALGDHFAAGRLDRGELDARLDAAYRATTLVELVQLFADLPDPAPFRPSRREQWRAARAARLPARWSAPIPVLPLLLILAVVAGAVWHVPVFLPVLWLWFWAGGGRRWRHHYRGSDTGRG